MDLRHLPQTPTPAERAAVDAVLGPAVPTPSASLQQSRALRHLLLPALQAAQARLGHVSPGALGYICARLEVPPAEAFGVASFYALLSLRERPPRALHVCEDLACQLRGAQALCERLTRDFAPAAEARDGACWLRSPCLGLCEQAPAALWTEAGERPLERALGQVDGDVLLASLRAVPAATPSPVLPQRGEPGLRLLARVGVVDPTSLDDYIAHGGYQALRRGLALGADAVIAEISAARLLGRGGAAFPTGRKWEAVARASRRPRYVVCNGDESEPGTFKDRVLMEQDPFALVEAMTLCGLSVGAERGYLYVRGEYALCAERLQRALDQCRARGLLGASLPALGSGLAFDIELRRGGGAYICGEETALLNSIEGLRGEPRSKPPFPVEVGLFGQPTVINNVETLVNTLDIVLHGAARFRALGTEGSAGTRLFCLSGDVAEPGLYEIPFGVTLRALLDRAGGVPGGGAPQAVLLGGAAGTFVTGDELDVPLTFEDTRRIGATLGSGVVLVLGPSAPLLPLLHRIAAFFRDESCGQCVPCRVGTVRQEELLQRLLAGRTLGAVGDELARLKDLGQVLRDASICGLGQTAASAIESAVGRLPLFPEAR